MIVANVKKKKKRLPRLPVVFHVCLQILTDTHPAVVKLEKVKRFAFLKMLAVALRHSFYFEGEHSPFP